MVLSKLQITPHHLILSTIIIFHGDLIETTYRNAIRLCFSTGFTKSFAVHIVLMVVVTFLDTC